MKKLLLARNDLLNDPLLPDTLLFSEIFKVFNLKISLVDRCDTIRMPYLFENTLPTPKTGLDTFQKTYEELCAERAQEIVRISKSLDKPIMITWSGGIDSTLVVDCFLKYCPNDLDRVHVALNAFSIKEYPLYYYNHIRPNFKLMSSENMMNHIDGSYVYTSGEFNDQLFGSDVLAGVIRFSGMDMVLAPHSESNIVPFWVARGMSEATAKFWYDLLCQHITKNAYKPITTVHEFFWWLNFNFKWASVYYRVPQRAVDRSLVTANFFDSFYQPFFVTEDFQRWAILNNHLKIGKTWESYKSLPKELILKSTHDLNYYENKIKVGSLSAVFRQRGCPDAIGLDTASNQYFYADTLDASEYYNPDNDFVQS